MAERKQKGGSRFLSVRPAAFLFKQKDGNSVFLLLSFLKFFLHEKERREKAYCEKKDVWLPIVALKIFPAFAKNSFVVEKARALSKNIPSRLQVFVFSFRLFLPIFSFLFFLSYFPFLFFPFFFFINENRPKQNAGGFLSFVLLSKFAGKPIFFSARFFPFPRKMASDAAYVLRFPVFLEDPQKVIPARRVFTFSPRDFFKRFVGRVKITFPFRTRGSTREIYLVRFFPQKNNATVPGPV